MSTWIDLSRPIVEGASAYPGDPLYQARPFADHATDGFRGTRLVVGTHLGTHVDAPFHYFVDGETLDSFPLDFFYGSAACLDLTDLIADAASVATTGRPFVIDAETLERFESAFESADFVFLRTGWAERYGRPDFYTAFPSLSTEACELLADYPRLRILGLETPSLVSFPVCVDHSESSTEPTKRPFDSDLADCLPTPNEALSSETIKEVEDDAPLSELELCADAECHRILLGRRPPILILEGLVGLEQLPSFSRNEAQDGRVPFDPKRSFDVSCFPAPFVGLDGCPVRVAARVDRSDRSINQG